MIWRLLIVDEFIARLNGSVRSTPSFQTGTYLGEGLAPTPHPLQPTEIFDDAIFAVLLIFLPEHQNLGIH